MKKDFIVSKIEASQDGSQYVFIALLILTNLSQQNKEEVEGVVYKVLLVKVVKQCHLPLQKT